MPSHYDALGVDRTASAEELRRAYRRAVKATHPDTGGTAEAFAHVQDVWAVLGHPAGRRAYDARNPRLRAGDAATPTTDAPSSSMSTSPVGGPTVAAPQSAPAPNVDPPESGPINPDVSTTSAPSGLTRSVQILCTAVAIVSGGATTWVISDLGRPLAAAAGIHMAMVGVLVARRMAGKTTGEGTYRRLVRAAWILVAGLALIAVLGWAMDHSPWPALLWSACVALYAASVSVLWRTTADREVT